ncbi:single-stranded-DNA-specific exonuclease RecJ [Flavobacteriaceae bacterium]|nr:single-stranded-DNA-specific exonuclease RecJ [Flavobacteriaceae bacterium]RZO98237.1 MAG: single-stranded-DNA-specific exonuclease RecJ [Flavobacteriales bacterium]
MYWEVNSADSKKEIKTLSKQLNVCNTTASLLITRDIKSFEDAKTFFRPSLDHLHDPFLMKDMGKAVKRILEAISNDEKILIYGDYDVDGTSSVALVCKFLRNNTTNQVSTYIPDRYDEGYGISYQSIDYAADNEFSLVIALDCGIKAVDKISYANNKNIDYIICDHHKPESVIPDAIAVLNPLRGDCSYPFKYLCGCGIGFKLIQALDITQDDWESNIENYLDLVAVAIGADLVPLIGENRTLCYFGLKVINLSPTIGLKAIIRGINKPEITLSEVSFYIAPRINSAGRIKHGNNAVELLLEENFDNAISFSKEIDNFNLQRRGLDQLITSQALKQIESNEEQKDFTTVVFKKDWHKGVIGIVASRLIEKYYRPTLVFTKSNDVLAASARSVKGYDVYNAIESCKEHLIQFGGHKYAAGLTLKPENYLAFKTSFEKHVKKTIKKEMLTPTITVEEKIQFSEITPKFFRILKQFAPFGPSNKQPVFWSDNLNDTGYCKTVGEEGKHLKLSLRQDNSDIFKAIAFGLGDKLSLVKNKAQFKAAFNIDENNWNGVKSVQLKLLDIKSND